jgi:cell division protein FtsZ
MKYKEESSNCKVDNDLIAMNEFIRNLDVTFEIVSPIKDIDFQFTTPM